MNRFVHRASARHNLYILRFPLATILIYLLLPPTNCESLVLSLFRLQVIKSPKGVGDNQSSYFPTFYSVMPCVSVTLIIEGRFGRISMIAYNIYT